MSANDQGPVDQPNPANHLNKDGQQQRMSSKISGDVPGPKLGKVSVVRLSLLLGLLLVRLVTPLASGESEELADKRLTEFAAAVMPLLPEFVPN